MDLASFSVALAQLVGSTGKVIAADLQQGMLRELTRKITGTALEPRITTIQCEEGRINVSEDVDFILAFYMVHEVPDRAALFQQLSAILRENGKLLLVEPRLFHVSKRDFASTLGIAKDAGFTVSRGPKLPLSWSAVLEM
ncbi:MAG TPA: class I SAM-dependent methyltransferase [Longimicrobiales bacterium]|nr:class I SAM-dependent methyltransferase [Longimicrobiales bacterium]